MGDEGVGIPDGVQREIFERGSSLNGGTGIGLHLARALVEAEDGRLVLARRLPAVRDTAATGERRGRGLSGARQSARRTSVAVASPERTAPSM